MVISLMRERERAWTKENIQGLRRNPSRACCRTSLQFGCGLVGVVVLVMSDHEVLPSADCKFLTDERC